MANTNAPYGFKPWRSSNGGVFDLDYGTLAGTVAQGDPLVRDSGTGNLKVHTAGAAERIVGVASMAGVANDVIGYFPADADTLFRTQSYRSTVLDNTYLYKAYDIAGTTGATGVDTSGATHPIFRVTQFAPDTTVGAYAEVIGMFQVSGYTGQGVFVQDV